MLTTIRVIDEGSGVAPEDIDKLFDPFFTTKETGTGLGLPVAHQIVGQMGGVLTAHRNRDGGMTFSIAFPLTQHTPSMNESILVVDDDRKSPLGDTNPA